jgi:hypothetical protein
MRLLKIIWARWKVIAHKVATFQARILLSAFYFAVLVPFAVGLRLASDPLRLRTPAGGWTLRGPQPGDAWTFARRQY